MAALDGAVFEVTAVRRNVDKSALAPDGIVHALTEPEPGQTLNLTQLKAFLWVAKLGGFRRAAEKLHTSHPAISARIAGLEQSLGVSLLERGASGVQLTAKGRELLDYAEKLTQIAETARQRIGDPGRRV